MVDALAAAEGIPVFLAQFDPDPLTRNPFVSLTSAAVSAFLSTVVVGAIVVAVAPNGRWTA
jgi:hypothetical protein